MKRRLFLATPLAAACGRTDLMSDEDDYLEHEGVGGWAGGLPYEMGRPGADASQHAGGPGESADGVPPWHMWGTSDVVDVQLAGGTSSVQASSQLAAINYKRPENWRFFFGARVLSGDIPTVVPVSFQIRFNLFFGVSRAIFDTSNDRSSAQSAFCEFNGVLFVGFGPQTLAPWYTSKVRTPLLDQQDPTTFEQIDLIPADRIQCNAQVSLAVGAPTPGERYQVEVSAFFAPNVHNRPDWFVDKFQGGELKGK